MRFCGRRRRAPPSSQLGLALHSQRGALKAACERVLPVFLGTEAYTEQYHERAGSTPQNCLVGFRSMHDEVMRGDDGTIVGMSGRQMGNEKKDDAGYFLPKPLLEQQGVLDTELFKKGGDIPRVAVEAGKLAPVRSPWDSKSSRACCVLTQATLWVLTRVDARLCPVCACARVPQLDVVKSMFMKQGIFTHDMLPAPPAEHAAAEADDSARANNNAPAGGSGGGVADATPAGAAVASNTGAGAISGASSGGATAADAQQHDTNDHRDVHRDEVLDTLAAKIAQVIEKAVDDQCRSLKTLGMKKDGRGTDDGAKSTYEELLGSKLIHCDRAGGKLVRTSNVLQREVGYVVVLFAEYKMEGFRRLAVVLSRAIREHGAKLRVVYVSNDANALDFKSATESLEMVGFYALPFRLKASLGQGVRRILNVKRFPTAVVTQWSMSGDGRYVYRVTNPDATIQIAHDAGRSSLSVPWDEEPIEELIGDFLIDRTLKLASTKTDVLNPDCQVCHLPTSPHISPHLPRYPHTPPGVAFHDRSYWCAPSGLPGARALLRRLLVPALPQLLAHRHEGVQRAHRRAGRERLPFRVRELGQVCRRVQQLPGAGR